MVYNAIYSNHTSTYVSAYSAPEQLVEPEKRPPYTIAADIWSVGQILVEAVTGHFSGSDPW
jgi:serine/threonine protein kinase